MGGKMAAITYRDLFALYREEKGSNALAQLPEQFDESLEHMIGELSKRAKTDAQALKEFDNAKKLAVSLIRLRRQKIILRSISSEEARVLGANQREQEFYEKMQKLCASQDSWLNGLIRAEAPSSEPVQSIKKIKILKSIPAYTGADSKEYGPYSQGDEISLPETEAEWMIKGNMAVSL